ncbi:hypothetical protein LIBAT_02405 [Leptospira interrogans]
MLHIKNPFFEPVYFSVKIEMWELPQIRILQIGSENIGTTTLKNSFFGFALNDVGAHHFKDYFWFSENF